MKPISQETDYHFTKKHLSLKEYIFMTRSGYRHFFVLGTDLKEAEHNFMRIDEIKRCGFTLEDLPIRLEYTEQVKEYSMDEIWERNENIKHNSNTKAH